MTQLGTCVSALNHDSRFQGAYENGMKKSEYWIHALEDCLTLIAKLPALAARIYRNVYKPGAEIPVLDKNLDLVGECNTRNTSPHSGVNRIDFIGNYAKLLGYGNNHSLTEYLRLYIAFHGDHEGGNASAHTARKSYRIREA